jgi:hypothetical protein
LRRQRLRRTGVTPQLRLDAAVLRAEKRTDRRREPANSADPLMSSNASDRFESVFRMSDIPVTLATLGLDEVRANLSFGSETLDAQEAP